MLSIFVSSTFNDMQAERDVIHQRVLPEFRRMAAVYGESARLVDLRWGVNTDAMDEASATQKVMDICLDEIDRCQGYMICLLGSRYGWIPDTAQNAGISVTEMEIRHGVFSRGRADRAILMFRDGIDELPPDERSRFEDHNPRLDALKEELASLPEGICDHYRLRRTQEQEFDGLDRFADLLIARLEQLLQRLFGDRTSLTPGEWLDRLFQGQIREKIYGYLPVPELEASFADWQKGTDTFFLLQAPSGMGKSAFIAHACENPPADVTVLPFFCGIAPECSRPEQIRTWLIDRLVKISGSTEDAFRTSSEAEELQLLTELLYRFHAAHRTLWIAIDAPDQLQCTPDETLCWLPPTLPPSVRIIIGTLPGDSSCAQLEAYWPVRTAVIPPVTEPKTLIRHLLAGERKELSEEIIGMAAARCTSGNYLYISMLVRDLLLTDRHDFQEINAHGGDIQSIHAFMRDKIRQMPDNLHAMSLFLMEDSGERLAPGMIRPLLAALSSSPAGLRVQDLEVLLADRWDEISFIRLTRFLDGILVERDSGCYDFAHQAAREAAETVTKYASVTVSGPVKNIPGDAATSPAKEVPAGAVNFSWKKRLTGYLTGLSDDDPLKCRIGLPLFLAFGETAAAASLIRSHPEDPALAAQVCTVLSEYSESVSLLLSEEGLLPWFLTQVTPGLTILSCQKAAARILKFLPEPKSFSDAMCFFREQARLQRCCDNLADAWQTEKKLLERMADIPAISPAELGFQYLLTAETAFAENEEDISAIYRWLKNAEYYLTAEKPVQDSPALLRCLFALSLMDHQTVLKHRLKSGAVSLRDFITRGDLARTVRPFLTELLKFRYMQEHIDTDAPALPQFVKKLQDLAERTRNCMESTEKALSGWHDAGSASSAEGIAVLPDPADLTELADLAIQIGRLLAETGQSDPAAAFLKQVRNLLRKYLRRHQKSACLLCLAHCQMQLAACMAPDSEKDSCALEACHIWQRYYDRRQIPEYAGYYRSCEEDLAKCFLSKGQTDAYLQHLQQAFQIRYDLAEAAVSQALDDCRRFPDETRGEVLETRRRELQNIWNEYVCRKWLRQFYDLPELLDNIFAVWSAAFYTGARMDNYVITPEHVRLLRHKKQEFQRMILLQPASEEPSAANIHASQSRSSVSERIDEDVSSGQCSVLEGDTKGADQIAQWRLVCHTLSEYMYQCLVILLRRLDDGDWFPGWGRQEYLDEMIALLRSLLSDSPGEADKIRLQYTLAVHLLERAEGNQSDRSRLPRHTYIETLRELASLLPTLAADVRDLLLPATPWYPAVSLHKVNGLLTRTCALLTENGTAAP